GDVTVSLAAGQHTVSFKDVAGYTRPVDKIVAINANAQTTESGTYTLIPPATYTLTINQAANGTISAQPWGINNSGTYTKGTVVELYGEPAFTYHLESWGGAASGNVNPTKITMDGDKTVTATFAIGDPSLGTFRVVAD